MAALIRIPGPPSAETKEALAFAQLLSTRKGYFAVYAQIRPQYGNDILAHTAMEQLRVQFNGKALYDTYESFRMSKYRYYHQHPEHRPGDPVPYRKVKGLLGK